MAYQNSMAQPARMKNASAEMENENSGQTFAQGPCFYKMVWVFTVSSIFGVIIETIFCSAFKGYVECRQGMIYGPFNQVYGFGAVLLAMLLLRVAGKGNVAVFLVSAVTGGVFEIICSCVQEYTFGTVSWDYMWMYFEIGGGRTNLLYMFFWGLLGIGYIRFMYPAISRLIERIHMRQGIVLTWVLVAFMAVNLALSATAVARWTERQAGVPAGSGVERFLDNHYPDELLKQIYPSMMPVAER